MRAVIQRVSSAAVEVDGEVKGEIGAGLLVLVAVEKGDGEKDVQYMADRLLRLRCFGDEAGRMNRSVQDAGGDLLVISQFTLAASLTKGRRPSFDRAEKPDVAETLFALLIEALKNSGTKVETGVFGALMNVNLVNSGPVTFVLDSPRRSN